MSHGWTPPAREDADKAWREGLDDGRTAKLRRLDAYKDGTLQACYLRGYDRGMQHALQRDYGPPPTAGR